MADYPRLNIIQQEDRKINCLELELYQWGIVVGAIGSIVFRVPNGYIQFFKNTCPFYYDKEESDGISVYPCKVDITATKL